MKTMTRNFTRDRDWIRACVARTPGAWGEFVRRTIPAAVHLVDRIFDRHGVISNRADREQVVENLYASFVVEDLKVLRSFRPEFDLFLWLAVRVRMECRRHLSESRRRSPLGTMRSAKEPDPERLVGVLQSIPSPVRAKLAAQFEGPPGRVPDSLRNILAEIRGKVIDVIVAGEAMTACLPFERLNAFADGVTTEKISLHINGCRNCTQELELIAAVGRLLRDLIMTRPKKFPTTGSEPLEKRVRLLLPSPPKPPRKQSRRRIGWGR